MQRGEARRAAENTRLKDAADDVQNAVEQQQLPAHVKQADGHADQPPGHEHRARAEEGDKIQKCEHQRDGQRIGNADDEERGEDDAHIQQCKDQLGAEEAEHRRAEAVPHQAHGVLAANAEIAVDVFAQVREIRRDDAAGEHQHRQEDDEIGHFERNVAGAAHHIAERAGEQGFEPFPRAVEQREDLVAHAGVFGGEAAQHLLQPGDQLVVQPLQIGDEAGHAARQIDGLRNQLPREEQAQAEQQRVKHQHEDVGKQAAGQPQVALEPRDDRVEHPRHDKREDERHQNTDDRAAEQRERDDADDADADFGNQAHIGAAAFAHRLRGAKFTHQAINPF